MGLGLKPKICRSTCTAWLSACRNDYFGFDSISGALVPCTASAVASRLLVCSRLKELAPEGAEQLCNMEGEGAGEGRQVRRSGQLSSMEGERVGVGRQVRGGGGGVSSCGP